MHWTAPTATLVSVSRGGVWLQHSLGQVLAGVEAVSFAPAYSASTGYRDMTADLLRLEVVEAEGKPATLTATLDNSTGQYSGLAALKVRSQVLLSQGYVGVGLAPTHLFYVQGWRFTRAVDTSEVTVTALDAAERLRYESAMPQSYANRQIGGITSDLAALAGMEQAVVYDASFTPGQGIDAFQVTAGSTYLAALERLLPVFAGGWRVQVGSGSGVAFAVLDWLNVIGKSALQTVVWTYTAEPERLTVGVDGDRANRVAVRGPSKVATAVGEAWDGSDLANTGRERYALAVEQLATTSGTAGQVAGLALAREQRLARSMEVAVGPNPALELLDAIAVTDSILPTSQGRITALTLSVEPRSGQWDLVLTCEGL